MAEEEKVRITPVDASTAREALKAALPKIAASIKRKVPKKKWKDPALVGQALYETMMMDKEVLARRKDAIEKKTDDDWRKAMIDKAAPIIAGRIDLEKYERNIAPYLSALAAVELPPREVDPMTNIENRLKPIVEALIAKKEELKGS